MPKLWPIARLRFRGLHARLSRKPGNGGPYFAMILINAIGYGLFAPFSILYFHLVVGLPLPLVGLGLSIATGVGLLATPLAAQLWTDLARAPLAMVTNPLSAVGFATYFSVHSFAAFLIVALFLAVGNASGGTAGQALVVELAAPEARDRWYALVRMAFNAGAGAGAAGWRARRGREHIRLSVGCWAERFELRVGGESSLSGTYAAWAWGRVSPERNYRTVLRDRPFLRLVGVNTILWMSVVALKVALPRIWSLPFTRQPGWLACCSR